MISCMPHNSRFHRKLTKEVTQVQCWNGTQKRGHKKANDLSHEIKGPKDATKQNGVYKFNCSECKSWYFGETGQRMEKRTYQHKNDVKNSKEINAILKHLQEHNDHSIQWKEVFCLENKEDWKKRKLKKLFILMQWIQKKL